MKPFSFHRAMSVEDAVDTLAQYGNDVAVLAGGQSLLLAMKERRSAPQFLVSLAGVPELQGHRYDSEGTLELGAMTTYSALARSCLPYQHQLLAGVAGDLADVCVRNMGTIGGAMCEADPRFDMPTLTLCLGAEVVLSSSRGTRAVPVAEFLVGVGRTSREPDELLRAIRVPPRAEGAVAAFEKFRIRRFDAALASVGCTLTRSPDGTVRTCRVVVGAVSATPRRMAETESLLTGQVVDESIADEASRLAMDEVEPEESPLVPAAYRRELVRTLVRRAVLNAASSSANGN